MVDPKVTIGVPLFNSEKNIKKCLDSILSQSYKDIQIIISDNHSTDNTENICREYLLQDSRIQYVRQSENIGMAGNFRFLITTAQSKYFMWWADDDIRSRDFVKLNVQVLEDDEGYVASTSPECEDVGKDSAGEIVDFSLEGNIEHRIRTWFLNCFHSHGITYSIIRTNVLKRYFELNSSTHLGNDWSMDMFLLRTGKIARTKNGLTIFGTNGMSRQDCYVASMRTKAIHYFLPFYEFSLFSYEMVADQRVMFRFWVIYRLIFLNLYIHLGPTYAVGKSFLKNFFGRNKKCM